MRRIRFLLVGAQVVTSVMAVVSIARTGLLSGREMFLLVAVLAVLATLSGVKLLLKERSTRKTQVFCGLMSGVCILGAVFGFRYAASLNNFLDKVSAPVGVGVVETEVDSTVRKPFVVYISGSDSRTGVSTTARSDVNIVAVVNPETGKILLVSIPRDTYVQLHDTAGTKDKLTHAGIYGIDMSRATVEDFLGIEVDYTVKVSFETVVAVVDQIDGVVINSDTAMRLKVEGKEKYCDYVVGAQEVDGDCALRFARERKTYTTGDRHRGENQQQVLSSIISKISGSRGYLLKLPEILEIAANSFETSFAREQITDLMRLQLEEQIAWKVETVAVNGTGSMQPTYSMGERPLYVMLADDSSIKTVAARIQEYLTERPFQDTLEAARPSLRS